MNMDQIDSNIQKEIIAARHAVQSHVEEAKRALDSLTQLARGDVGINQFRALTEALDGFAPAKKAVELGRKIVKRKLQDELNGGSKVAKEDE
jgi:hypothetical protein